MSSNQKRRKSSSRNKDWVEDSLSDGDLEKLLKCKQLSVVLTPLDNTQNEAVGSLTTEKLRKTPSHSRSLTIDSEASIISNPSLSNNEDDIVLSSPNRDTSPFARSSNESLLTDKSNQLLNQTSHIKSFYDFSTTHFNFRESDEEYEDIFEITQKVIKPPTRGPFSSEIRASLSDFSIPKVKQVPVILNEKDKFNAPEFISSFESNESLNGLRKSVRDVYGIDDSKAKSMFSKKFRVLQPPDKAPTNKDITNWIKAKKILFETKNKETTAKEDCSDNEEDMPTQLNTTRVLRVRQNSEDSLGSELSCSPPSPVMSQERSVIESPNTTPINKLKDKKEIPSSDGEDDDIIQSSQMECSTPQLSRSSILLRRKLMNTNYKKKFSSFNSGKSSLIESQLIDAPSICPAIPLDNLQNAHTFHRYQHLTIMSVEVYVRSRPKLKPDPEFDEIGAIFYHIMNDIPELSGNTQITGLQVLATDKDNQIKLEANMENISIDFSSSEYDLIKDFVKIVYEHDPDMITGYETHQLSWGYIIKRARFINIDLISALSRIIKEQDQKTIDLYEGENEYEMDFKIEGRIILNIWKLLRSEASLYSYTFENMMFHILHKRVPKYDDEMLSSWWNYGCNRWKVIEYFIKRVQGNVSILEQLDLFGRNSELARLFGIQFYEVISRGSQFRVESMMLRLAKSQNYVSLSPSVRQRARMRSGEYIPLVMEPESKFYTDPVILLDFQSLYPSIIMAYNYCFTTCLGRVLQSQDNEDSYEFGCSVLPHPTLSELARLEDHLTFSPGGIAFLKASVRKGILPEMLHKILDTRVMVKRSMKLYRDDNILKRTLHARQLGLKLIANVTYGYTSANFSGRMPCIEVGDSVVSKGRETLERCIKLIESHPSWNGRVVYGDTDSVFVLLKGRTKEEAFNIGDEMAKAVTLDNPKPVKLKFEKVYMGCILQTKKRYVGYMYESRDQSDPIYDAKGIETVRRDGCPAVAKILEKSLRILFETKDVTKVRTYVQRQFHKILSGKIPLQDLTFAKEFRGLKGYRPGACVPSLELTRRLMKKDRMNVPRIGQRVPYIIIYGEPGRPLIQSVRSPQEVMESGLRPNSTYYVSKVIGPPLDRCFSLLGVDIHSWYNDLPKGFKPRFTGLEGSDKDKRAILRYFTAFFCAVCDKSMSNSDGICSFCKLNPQSSAIILNRKMNKWSGELSQAMLQCLKCTQLNKFNNECVSIDCPMFYKRNTAALDSAQIPYLVSLLDKL